MPEPDAETDALDEGRQPVIRYRTAVEVHLDFPEAVTRVREQLRIWLRDKKYDVERFDEQVPEIGPGAVLLHGATNTADGWNLRERRPDGVTWVSTVAVTRAKGRRHSWVSVNVEPSAPAGRRVPVPEPPKIVRLLLDTVDAFDGELPLRSRPTQVGPRDVDELLEHVCAEDRRLPLVIAAPPPNGSFEQWRHETERLMRSLPGLAGMFLLEPSGTRDFNAGIGATHGIVPGSVRTYLSEVDPAIAEDAVRHRVLSRTRIEGEPERAARTLAVLPRQRAANSLPPAALKGLNLSMLTFARGTVDHTDQAHQADRTAALLAEQKLLTELLEHGDAIVRQLNETVGRQQEELLDLTTDLQSAQEELERRDATIRMLRRKLAESNRHAEAYAVPEPAPPLPTSFAEVLDRLEDLAPAVVFTGNLGPPLDLDEHPAHAAWAQVAWQALLALADYVRAKRDGWSGGDFTRWCESPPDGGRVISAGKVARDESRTVQANRRFAQERTLPVPPEVHPNGKVFMGAHVRLGTTGTVSPRLHFHDASASHQAVYVGYIGRHLPNTRTT